MSTDTTAPAVYTPDEFAKLVKISRTTAYNLMVSGKIRSFRVGRSRRIPATELDRFLGSASGTEAAS